MPTIDRAEYEAVKKWYEEWFRACMTITAFCFAAIAVTVSVFKIGSGPPLPAEISSWIKRGWLLLATSGSLTAVGIVIAYVWFDAVTKTHIPSLIGKVARSSPPALFLKLGTVGWVLTFVALAVLVVGLLCLLKASLLLLSFDGSSRVGAS